MALKAQYTAYHDTMRSANGTYPNENTCAAPPEIPFGTKIKVSGTGTAMDGRVYTVTDRGGAVKKTGDRYIFDLWMPSEKKCLEFGRRNGMAEVVKGNSASATVNKKKSSRKKTGGSDIIDVAASQIGYKESGENQTKYGAWYGMNGAPWCHMFVSWCADQAGVPVSVVPKTASTTEGMEWFKSRGLFKYKGKYKPKRGDLVYFKTGRSHVGLVEKVTGSTLHTIEGNTSDKVARRTYPLSNKTITGYGTPKYTYTNTTGSGSNSAKAEEAAKKELAMLKKVLARHPAEEMVIINAKTKETMELPEGRACVGIIRCGKAFMVPAMEGMKITWERKGAPGKLEFKALYDKDFKINEGNTVIIQSEGKDFFKGYIFSRKMSKDGIMSYTAYDQLRYLKNKDTFIYKNKTATEVIKTIAGRFRLDCGKLDDTVYKMSAIEDGTTLFDIIQNALDDTLVFTGRMYVLYDSFGDLVLSDVADMKVNSCVVDEETGGDFTYETTIDDGVYNKVKLVYENKKKGCYDKYVSQDARNMDKWGVLQYHDKISTPKLGKLKADALLDLYNQKKRSLSVSGVIGNTNVRAGSLVPVILNLQDIKISNYMMVEKVTHKFENRHYSMDLVLSGGGFSG